jgi:hypothetical protein
MDNTIGGGVETQGKYVTSVNVTAGEVIVQYGNDAHANIATLFLYLTPYLSTDDSVIWRCGFAAVPAGAAGGPMGAVVAGTTVPVQYLPAACRP